MLQLVRNVVGVLTDAHSMKDLQRIRESADHEVVLICGETFTGLDADVSHVRNLRNL